MAITYLKVADREEYKKYLLFCNTPINRVFSFVGKAKCLKVEGQYANDKGDWYSSKKPTITLVPYGTKEISFEAYQQMIIIPIELPIQTRIPSIDDFYKNWKSNILQAGLIDERSGVS